MVMTLPSISRCDGCSCDEPASITDAYALMKILNRDYGVFVLKLSLIWFVVCARDKNCLPRCQSDRRSDVARVGGHGLTRKS